ncbi:cold-shock protein [Paenibacillus sp. CC-CFT747]|nr:cold-shock protein [Paenibacillus sp. CC-CFT747]
MYNKRIPLEDLPHEETKVWTCRDETCKGWIRDNFAFEHVPSCPLCHSAMVSSVKRLPSVANSSKGQKTR